MGFKVDTVIRGVRPDTGEASSGVMPALADVAEGARYVESMGYDGITVPETSHDALLPCVLVAEHTSRVTISTGVTIAFPRSPMVMAMQAWDIQQFSSGRFSLGLGTQVKGHIQRRFSVPWVPPAPRIREYVLALKAIWHSFQTGEPLNFVGEHYTFTLLTPNFNPGPIAHPHIPVQIAAVNEHNARVAGEVCDGIRLHGFNTMKYCKEVVLPNVMKGLAKSGRTRDQFEVTGGGFLATGPDWPSTERAAQAVKAQIGFYGSTRTYQAVFEAHGWEGIAGQLHEMSLQGKWAEMPALIRDEMLEAFAVIAPWDKLPAAMRERYAGVVDRISFGAVPQNPDEEAAIRGIIRDLQQ